MSISRHHAEWLSLLNISDPFLSLKVLASAFPQGFDAPDADVARELRLAYEEWLDSAFGNRPDADIHWAWAEWCCGACSLCQPRWLFGYRVAGEQTGIALEDAFLQRLTIRVPEYSETLQRFAPRLT